MLEAFIGTATVFVTQAIFVPYIMLMLEYREPVRFWRTLWIGIISVIVFLNIGCILYFDFSFLSRCGTFTLVLPCILATIVCSRCSSCCSGACGMCTSAC